MKTGEIYWVNLAPTIGNEIKKTRPVIILNGGHEKHLKLSIVVSITEWSSYWEGNPFFVSLEPSLTNGLQKNQQLIVFRSGLLVMKDLLIR